MKKRGISLIVLVVTIIVIIILVGAVILSLTNNNPIEEANEATFKSNIETYNSEITLYVANEYTTTIGTFRLEDLNKNSSNIKTDVIKSMKDSDVPKFEIQKGTLVYIKDKCTSNEIKWLTDVGVKEKSNIPIYSYDKPIIPIGFTYKEGTWDTGYVIVDSKDNEFVWVPIDGTNVKYEKNLTYPGAQINILDDKLPVGVSNEQEQIINYGGFYIARYEAGKETSDVLVSKKGRNVWNNINYTDSKIKAEAMYTTVEVKSGLVTGTMWDSIMKWISNSSKSVLDSTSWGNYINSVAPANVVGCRSLQTTGFTEEWKIKNIYDIAGNAWEWTNEICNTYRINRGGVYGASGLDYPASSRADNDVPCSYDGLSYRIALYIK